MRQDEVIIELDEFEMSFDGSTPMLIGKSGIWASVDVEVDTIRWSGHRVDISRIWQGDQWNHNHQKPLCPKEYGWFYEAAQAYAESISREIALSVYEARAA